MMIKHLKIIRPFFEINSLSDFSVKSKNFFYQERKLGDLSGIFSDAEAQKNMDSEQPVYRVQAWMPVKEGTQGGLYYGYSQILPGKVGNEFFMTKGHFHMQSDRAEFYWGVQGHGMLILMDHKRNTWAEEVYPGSLHYINSNVAHRLANTRDEPLLVGACWPSDAGHDYEEIARHGFSARLVEKNGVPALIED